VEIAAENPSAFMSLMATLLFWRPRFLDVLKQVVSFNIRFDHLYDTPANNEYFYILIS
jgi:hypothetical protein